MIGFCKEASAVFGKDVLTTLQRMNEHRKTNQVYVPDGTAHVVVDIETLSLDIQNPQILSIGAVALNTSYEVSGVFYMEGTHAFPSGKIDLGTLKWWMDASDSMLELQRLLDLPLRIVDGHAVTHFSEWLHPTHLDRGPNNIQLWGNGPEFDNQILNNAMPGRSLPVKFWAWQSIRTAKLILQSLDGGAVWEALRERIDEIPLTPHNALHDAYREALILYTLNQRLNK